MIPILLLLAGALQQEPARRPPSAPPAHVVVPPPAPPVSAIDSTVKAISDIGVKVAELRSIYDLYRRAAYNEPDGALMQRATMFGASCRDVASAAQRGRGYICRSCLARRVQADIDQYKAYLPALERFGTACASRIEQLRARGDTRAQSKALRDDANPQGARMVAALRVYEARLQKVRVGMNWASPEPSTRRGT